MKKHVFAIGFALSFFVLNTQARQITVNVANVTFSPKNFTAIIGDTIRFVWVAGVHTTTSTSVPAGALTWDKPIDNTHLTFLYPVKVAGTYNYKCTFHAAMGMVGSFIVPPLAQLATTQVGILNNCANKDSIQYKCTKSKPPYKVQLFRYGVPFGSVRTVPDTMKFFFKNLPVGSYFATVKGNNGADSLTGKSSTSSVVPIPTNLLKRNVTGTKATLKWSRYSCVKYYLIEFRIKGMSTWQRKNTIGNKDSIDLTGLTRNSKYEFHIQAVDSANKISAFGKFSVLDSFMTTNAATLARDANSPEAVIGQSGDKASTVLIFPNPSSNHFKIQTTDQTFVSVILRRVDGKVIWRKSGSNLLTKNNQLDVDVNGVADGTYLLQLTDANNKSIFKEIIVIK